MTNTRAPDPDLDADPEEDGPFLPDTAVATPEDAGERLDRFLARRFGALSRSRIKNLILDGMARRDEVTVRDPSEPVLPGQSYRLTIPEAVPAIPQPEAIPLTIFTRIPISS